MKRELNRTIGLRVKRAREPSGLTQEELAELIDRSKEAVSNIERGVSLPGLDTIQTICDVTKVPMTTIIEENSDNVFAANLRARLNAAISHLTDNQKKLAIALIEVVKSSSE